MLQRDYYYILEFDSNVISYKEILINDEWKDKELNYAPHIKVNKDDKNQIIIILYNKYIEKNSGNIEISKTFCEQNDYNLVLITEKSINKVLLSNLKFLYRFSRQEPTKFEKHRILKLFEKYHCISIKNLQRYFSEKLIPKIYNMIISGELDIDFYEKFDEMTKIKIKEENYV